MGEVWCLQAVELVPLPEGVPEVLSVTCNGRSGRLLVRSQRVLQGDTEMSASKFEQVCGKGDAKKWKSSIWTEGKDGQQDMVCMLLLISHDRWLWSRVTAYWLGFSCMQARFAFLCNSLCSDHFL